MIDLCLLGTGGTMPLPERALTSLYVKYNGHGLLIDCGEGTQIMIRRKKMSLHDIDVILFTHYHADHISGLPGLLLSVAKSERCEPITLAGPGELRNVVESLCVIARELPFEIRYIEFDGEYRRLDLIGLKIDAFPVRHSVMCYGYALSLERAGKFDPVRAKQLGIPQKMWKQLQNNLTAEYNGRIFYPCDVLGKPRKGIKVTYCTDTRPTDTMLRYAKNSDLFICEGMYAEPEKITKAEKNFHCMFSEAAQLAKDADVSCLWLTHFSPSLSNPESYLDEVKRVFENTVIPEDMQSLTLGFEDSWSGALSAVILDYNELPSARKG